MTTDDMVFDLTLESLVEEFSVKKEVTNVKRALSKKEIDNFWEECKSAAVKKFKSSKRYTKACIAKGNAKIDSEIDKVINAQKYKTMNMIAKGTTKTVIVAALVGALVAAIVLPGGLLIAGNAARAAL